MDKSVETALQKIRSECGRKDKDLKEACEAALSKFIRLFECP
jgi:hypothetical protein